MKKLRLLDAFCCAGGTSYGYYQAGFEVVGVDHEPQPRFPFEFHQADAIEFIAEYGQEFDVISASPPCQPYSITASLSNGSHPALVTEVRNALKNTGKPYVIENVPGAPLLNPIKLNGSMFGLRVKRERLFETNPYIWFPPSKGYQLGQCAPRGEYDRGQHGLITVAGHNFEPKFAGHAMGIDWMTGAELSQAIPPAYTKWIGERLLEMIGAASPLEVTR